MAVDKRYDKGGEQCRRRLKCLGHLRRLKTGASFELGVKFIAAARS